MYLEFGIFDVVFSVQSPPTKLLMEWMRPFSATESHLAVKIILVIDAHELMVVVMVKTRMQVLDRSAR